MRLFKKMMSEELKSKFGGKKITVMGLGLLGRGVGDAEFFAEAGAHVIVTDMKNENELRPSVERLSKYPNIEFHLGGHRMEDFENRDLIIRANNAPIDSPFIAHARERGERIEMDSALFVRSVREEYPAGENSYKEDIDGKKSGQKIKIIGVTGTRGKSTTTHLIYEILKAAYENHGGAKGDGSQTKDDDKVTKDEKLQDKKSTRVFLGGNELGVATLSLLKEVQPGDFVVLELDSWQLQGFAEDKISPDIAVWTNFMRDHMNYYRGDMKRYFEDKAAIARFQNPDGIFITTSEIAQKIEAEFGAADGRVETDPVFPDEWKILLPGDHNRKNAAFALAAARAAGVTDEISRKVFEEFHGLPYRLENIGEKNGVAFYNDSNATTPEAVIAALRALRPAAAGRGGGIILIAGGSDKDMIFDELADEIKKSVRAAVFFKGAATEKLTALLAGKPLEIVNSAADNMDEAVKQALSAAKPKDIILLSPGATSFGIFKNEYDRGDQFNNAFAQL